MIKTKILILNDSDLCKASKNKNFDEINVSDFYLDIPRLIEEFDYIVYKTDKGCKPLKQRFDRVITEWQTA